MAARLILTILIRVHELPPRHQGQNPRLPHRPLLIIRQAHQVHGPAHSLSHILTQNVAPNLP